MPTRQSPTPDIPKNSCQPWQPQLGAIPVTGQGVRFTVWAARARQIDVLLYAGNGARTFALDPQASGVFSGLAPDVSAGARYKYRVDGGDAFPDPCSRAQPDGVHGPSEVVDPAAFHWRDGGWPGLDAERLVIYECHVGTATPEGTFAALVPQLKELRRLGVTAIELMPVASFPGRWNWGYDGVSLYAPAHVYGGPDGLRRLVDAAHRNGLGVILDVVYNHLGPDGNYLRAFSPDYFTDRYQTPWGEALNYDGPQSEYVRQYVIENAGHWLAEYHLDGLRLDATHAIHDGSPRHLLQELTERARAAVRRPVLVIAESDLNDVRLIDPAARGGYGLDAVWADDFHHTLRTYLTGERDGYYADYSGRLDDVARAVQQGFLYQGEPSRVSGRPRGTPTGGQPAHQFVFCIQNHDQTGNRALGERLHHQIDPQRYAVASALLLLATETPLLFMGQEFAASSPFQYFTDHHEELGRLVTQGRREEFKGFSAFSDPVRRETIPDPQDEATFRRSKLDLSERQQHAGIYWLYRDLLRLRMNDPVLGVPDRARLTVQAVTDDLLIMHRWTEVGHRLVIANFGPAAQVDLPSSSIVIVDGPHKHGWRLLLSTAARKFGGAGARPSIRLTREGVRVRVPERTAVVFASPPTG